MANIIAEAFALYNNTNNIPVGYVIRDILFKNGNPLGCGSASNLSLRQSGFWHRSAPEPGEGGDEHYLEKSLADGIFQAPRYKSALEWTGQRHLYRRLLAKETSALELWEADFLDDEATSTVGAFSEIDADLQSAFTLDSIIQKNLGVLEGSTQSKLDSLHWVDQAFNSSIEVDSVALLAQLNSLLDSLLYFQAYGYDQARVIVGSRSVALGDILTDNNGISIDSIYESNEQLANYIFLETVALGIDTFTQFQIDKLLAVANQCPLAGGDGVFKARSLYSLADPLVKYDDEIFCGAEPEARPQHILQPQLPEGFRLIPNPANDELTVLLSEPLGQSGHFVAFNLRGQVQMERQLDAGEAAFFVNTSRLPAGIYYCTIRCGGSAQKNQKLIIIR